MDDDQKDIEKQMAERLALLPPVIQRAIGSAEIETHLRALANTHKLHLDQWDALENEVKLALLGFQETEDLAKNIEKEVGVDQPTAVALAGDISKSVFEPIRQELERQLEHPEAQAEQKTGVETVRDQMLASENTPTISPTRAVVQPATPPPAPPVGAVERAQIAPTYAAQTPSHERKSIEGDPYREQVA